MGRNAFPKRSRHADRTARRSQINCTALAAHSGRKFGAMQLISSHASRGSISQRIQSACVCKRSLVIRSSERPSSGQKRTLPHQPRPLLQSKSILNLLNPAVLYIPTSCESSSNLTHVTHDSVIPSLCFRATARVSRMCLEILETDHFRSASGTNWALQTVISVRISKSAAHGMKGEAKRNKRGKGWEEETEGKR